MRIITIALAGMGMLACAGLGAAAEGNVLFVLDSSGSMAGTLEGKAKIEIARQVNYSGYIETGGIATFRPRDTQLAEIFAELKAGGLPVGTSHLSSQEDVWGAIRQFFTEQARDD